MSEGYRYLAFDLGAESGRAVLGTLSELGGAPHLALKVILPFPTQGIEILGTRQWRTKHEQE